MTFFSVSKQSLLDQAHTGWAWSGEEGQWWVLVSKVHEWRCSYSSATQEDVISYSGRIREIVFLDRKKEKGTHGHL